jgi:hypothetical protein
MKTDKWVLWAVFTWFWLLASCVLLWWYAKTTNMAYPLLVVSIWAALPLYRVCAHLPVLTDAPAIALALLSARYAAVDDNLPAAVVSVVAGAINEKAPVFAALWSESFYPLAGLAAVLVATLGVKAKSPSEEVKWPWFTMKKARQRNSTRLDSATALLMPWGACLAAAFCRHWNWIDWLTLAVAYGQLIIAVDGARLYQWAFPVLLRKTTAILPKYLHGPAVLVTWFNPWGGIRI